MLYYLLNLRPDPEYAVLWEEREAVGCVQPHPRPGPNEVEESHSLCRKTAMKCI